MCLAIPAQIKELLEDEVAVVEISGVTRKVQVNLIDSPKVGEYVVVHAGFALSKLDEDEAAKTLELLREVGLVPRVEDQ
jgi:hydrogenase expression/formation protein HypC